MNKSDQNIYLCTLPKLMNGVFLGRVTETAVHFNVRLISLKEGFGWVTFVK